MTNEIVKQDTKEVQTVSGYEAFREQCTKMVKGLGLTYTINGNNTQASLCTLIAEYIRALPLPEVKQESIEINWPDYHHQAMGCGLEDRGIRDKYDAMRHGWDCAVERCIEAVGDDPLYLAPPDVEAMRKENENLNAEVLKLHRELAGEKLRADQGWARYESANRMIMSANVEIMQLKGGAA